MEFTAWVLHENPPVPDGHGGVFLQETWELTITDATGIYSPYKGGHNHMVDRIDALPSGLFDENCYASSVLVAARPLWWTSNCSEVKTGNRPTSRVWR